jgi:hypothetical protein
MVEMKTIRRSIDIDNKMKELTKVVTISLQREVEAWFEAMRIKVSDRCLVNYSINFNNQDVINAI